MRYDSGDCVRCGRDALLNADTMTCHRCESKWWEFALPTDTSVYFIPDRTRDEVKIGYSDSVMRRLYEIQLMGYSGAYLLGTVPGGRKREAELHKQFNDFRLYGEWFRFAPEIIEWVVMNARLYLDIDYYKNRRPRWFIAEVAPF